MLPLLLLASLTAGATLPALAQPELPLRASNLPLPAQRGEGWGGGLQTCSNLPLPAERGEELTLALRQQPILPLPAQRGEGRGGGLRQEEDWETPRYDDEDAPRPHLLLSGWGGEALAHGGAGRSSSFYGGEVAWAFSSLDLGVAGSFYRSLRDADRAWTPVILTRVTQRFMTHRGFEAAFSLGFGAGKPKDWVGWYQVALGLRVPLGPLFLGGELAFEQYDIIRLGAGLGVGF